MESVCDLVEHSTICSGDPDAATTVTASVCAALDVPLHCSNLKCDSGDLTNEAKSVRGNEPLV